MSPHIDILYLFMGAFGVLGIIEWIKSLISGIEKKNGKAVGWVFLSLGLSFIVAAAGGGGTWQILTNGILILAFNELVGYNMILKAVYTMIDRFTGSSDDASATVEMISKLADGGSQPNQPPAAISSSATGSVPPISVEGKP
jgi:hypothetical protein